MRPVVEHFDENTRFAKAVAAYIEAKCASLNLLYMAINSMRSGTSSGTYGWCACASVHSETCGVIVVRGTGLHRVAWVSDFDEDVAQAFADAIRRDGVALTGLAGPRDAAYGLARALGGAFDQRARLGNHVLDQPPRLLTAAGSMRRAEMRDLERLVAWQIAFVEECNLADDISGTMERIRVTLSNSEPPFWIWELEGRAVATATLNVRYGIARIAGVYTPLTERRHGYAGALVSNLSAWAQAQGAGRAFLYTDLANPVSNGIYRKIGYRMIDEHVHLDLQAN